MVSDLGAVLRLVNDQIPLVKEVPLEQLHLVGLLVDQALADVRSKRQSVRQVVQRSILYLSFAAGENQAIILHL